MEGLIENSERPTLPDPALMQLVAASASLRHLTGPLATVTWEELAADCAPPSGEVRLVRTVLLRRLAALGVSLSDRQAFASTFCALPCRPGGGPARPTTADCAAAASADASATAAPPDSKLPGEVSDALSWNFQQPLPAAATAPLEEQPYPPPRGQLSAPPPAPPSQDRVTAEAARALSGSLSSLFAMLEERDEELRRLRGQLELSQRRGRKLQALLNEAYDKEAASIIDAALKGTQQILTAQAAAGCGNDRPLDALDMP